MKLDNETKKRSDSPKRVKVAGSDHKTDRNKKTVKKKPVGREAESREEDSGSETDEPGATSDGQFILIVRPDPIHSCRT